MDVRMWMFIWLGVAVTLFVVWVILMIKLWRDR